jgi:tetratricopeptide (TPR) repeat protein
MKASKIYIGIIVLVAFACSSTSKTVRTDRELSLLNTQYYKLFTDATKHALFGNNRTAISLYNACISQFPDRAAPYYQLSSIYLKENDVDKAKEYAVIAESLNDSNIWYKAHLANIYQYNNNLDSAAVLYEEIIRERNDLDTKYNLALLYSQIKNNERAIELLDELDNEIKGSRSLFLMKHNVYHNMGEFDSAIVVLESMIKYFPEDVTNYGILAEYLAEVGKNGYASEVYLDLLKQDSLNGLALLSYADFFMINNKPDSAFVYYKKAVCCSNLDFDEKISIIVNFISNKMVLEIYSERVIELLDIIRMSYNDFRVYASYTDIYIT